VDAAASGAQVNCRAGFGLSRTRERSNGAQTNGAEAYGEVVWFWHPLLVSSRRRRVGPTGRGYSVNSPTTVTRRIRRRGERGISRKTIAQGMSDVLRCPVCSCAFCFLPFARETAGAARIRHSLLPHFRGTTKRKPRAHPAAGRRTRIRCLKFESENKPRRPGQASIASADPGPTRRGVHYQARWWTAFSRQLAPEIMGPGSEAGTTR
jgi:hypothetical protein